MTVAGRIRDKVLSGAIADRLRQYERYQDEPARRATQLGLWNTEWRRILAESDYYHRLAGDRGLPFCSGMPAGSSVDRNRRISLGSPAEPPPSPSNSPPGKASSTTRAPTSGLADRGTESAPPRGCF